QPLPPFTHDLGDLIMRNGYLVASKSGPADPQHRAACRPDVTMRLETPLIYFHPPTRDWPIRTSVEVTLHGGWLTQFYPDARADVPGGFNALSSESTGSLAWDDLKIGGTAT